ncbi:MAG TPA: two-component regulator propeller domain-containing protein [Bacteroidales bacterium]|nr:two-component regulator propeller domain-containing protein [Bacteroidales bacterium]
MKRLIILLNSLIIVLQVFCTDVSKIKFEYLTVDDGLSQGVVEDILQDMQGFMWIATRDGLNRYDGRQFTTFRNDRNDPQSLASNWILSLAEDRSGKLWIGSEGLNLYDPVMSRMTRIPVKPDDPQAFHGGRVYSITVDFDSTLWFSTTNGLVHYFPKQNRYKTYTHDPDDPGSPGSTEVFSTYVTRDNRLLVGLNADPVYEFDRKNETFTAIRYKLAYTGSNNLKYMQEDQNGLIYITSEFSAVHVYNPVTGESRLIDRTEGGLNATSIKTRVLPVNANEIWIGTDGGGINIHDPVTGEMQYLMVDTRNNYSLSGNAIFKIYQDRDKNIWVGHFGSGISVWKRNKEIFTSYAHNPFNPASINKEVVTGIYEDASGRIWIGQDGGGLSLFNEENQAFEHIRARAGDPGSLTSDVILSFNEDPDGNLLLGTYSGGMMVFNPDTRRVEKAYFASDGVGSNHVWYIFKDSKGRYWLATLGAGFTLFDPLTKTFTNFSQSSEEIASCSNSIMTITEDDQGRIWLGSENAGICVLDYDRKEIRNYRHDENNKNSISYNDIKSIVFLSNYAWIATNGGGLNRLDLRTDSFRIYTTDNGLTSDALMGILIDNKSNLWISSTRGLMKFNPVTEEIEVYDKSQGIQGSEFKYNSQCHLRDGRMMFGGVNGLTFFHPDSIRYSSIIPNIVFTDFKIYDKSAIPGAKHSPIKQHINFTGFIKLNPRQSAFTIEFASLDYNTPAKNRFMYKLEGFDEDWVNAGNRSFVTYTNLDAGKYTFLLKGSNSDGLFNENPRKLVIRIRPPWYVTRLAVVLYVILAAMLIVLYIKQREKQSIQDKLILEEKIQEAQAELKGKVNELERKQEELRRRDEEEKDIRFFTEGIARFSDIIAKKRRNLEELATGIISELVRYVDASAGGIFILDDSDPGHLLLKATGEFCFSSDNERKPVFEAGEGTIGTCFIEQKTIVLENAPDNYIKMRSGLGEISLHHVIYIPVLQDKMCVGVIEIASIQKLPPNKVMFCEKIAESLAAIVAIIKANEKTQEMLERNNIQAEELRAQEEEMRQNLEELQATQDMSQRKEKEIVAELAEKTKLIGILQEDIRKLKI